MVLGLVALTLPLIVTQPSRQLLYATILAYAICGTSLTVLTGWAGQVSLGQMAFAGIGALIAANLTQGISLDIGWGNTRLVNVAFNGEPFWFSIVIAAVVTAILAAIIGIGSLRVRGLMLAVSTFAFAVAAQQYLYHRPILNGHNDSSVPFTRGQLFGIDFTGQRPYYYAVLVVLVVLLWVIARLRRSGVGRTMIAVRDNADAAAAYTVSPTRSRMQAFALAGGIAGLGGALLAGVVQSVPYTEEFFLVNDSLVLVSLVVIGGLGSTTGPVLGALWIVGLPAFAPTNQIVALLSSSLGLLILLLYFPSGLVGVAYRTREAVLRWAENRVPETVAARPKVVPAVPRTVTGQHARSEGDMLVVSDIGVHFGGVSAVDGVSLRVGAGEIVGLIGTNGAGKSTLMNAIGGFCTANGSVLLHDRDISHLTPAKRARLGLGRTFQEARLFPELTVRETVQVALEARHRTGLLSTALLFPPAIRRERAKASGGGRDPRLPRTREICRPLHRRPVHRHPADRRTRRAARARCPDAVPRRTDRRRRAARNRGIRAAAAEYPQRTRRLDADHRARHATDHGYQRSGLLPRSGSGHRRRKPCRGTRRSARHRQLSRDR